VSILSRARMTDAGQWLKQDTGYLHPSILGVAIPLSVALA